ncbi:MAG: hypothetical protein C0609_04205 [Deltaproteobacteria bacterium]|nr:MAG: hypothetical protein C0609_04205 [Deltaproteobacteria bacterium]
MAEKRAAVRKKVRWSVRVMPSKLLCPTQDVSENGMFLISSKAFPIGTHLELLVYPRGAQEGIAAEGIVCRHKRGNVGMVSSARPGFAIELINISSELEEAIKTIYR